MMWRGCCRPVLGGRAKAMRWRSPARNDATSFDRGHAERSPAGDRVGTNSIRPPGSSRRLRPQDGAATSRARRLRRSRTRRFRWTGRTRRIRARRPRCARPAAHTRDRIFYTFGGSALDSPPYQLRPDVPVTEPQFARNGFGATFGGPLRIPHLIADTNRRTNFQIQLTRGNESNNVFDQYATVPTDAMRSGDFSANPIPLIDPASGRGVRRQSDSCEPYRPERREPPASSFHRPTCRGPRRTITCRRPRIPRPKRSAFA